MKKLFTALMLFAVSAPLLNAKVSYSFSTRNWRNLAPVVSDKNVLAPSTQPMSLIPASKLPGVQAAIKYTALYDSLGGLGISYMGPITPVSYDPNSNGVFVVANGVDQTEQGSLDDGNLRVFVTYDNGENWNRADVVEYGAEMQFVYPTIVASTSAPDIEQSKYAVCASILTPGDNTLYYDGVHMWAHLEDNSLLDQPLKDIEIAVSGEKQTWRTVKSTNVASGDNQMGYFFNRTLKPQGAPTTAKAGYYGLVSFDFFNTDIPLGEGKIPDRFLVSEFSKPTNADASSGPEDFLSAFEMSTDNDGNVYAACMNFFSDNSTTRVPAVAKSTDGGKTWSSWNKMPYALIDNYVAEHNLSGFTNSINWTPYQKDAFVAYGDNQYSYFFRAACDSTVDGQAATISWAIYEAYYNGTVWGMRKVSELLLPEDADIYSIWLGGRETQLLEPVTISDVEFDMSTVGDVKLAVRLTYVDEGNELQAAKTADGQNIVLKWIDNTERLSLNDYPLHHIDTVGNNGINIQTDTKMTSMFTTDVFMTYKSISGSTWAKKANATQDSAFDRATHIPAIVKDLENVPLVTSSAKFRFNNWSNAPQIFNDMVPYWYWTQDAIYANINVTTVSVEDKEETYGFSLSDAYPNPAEGSAEIGFNLDISGNVTLEVYNALGQKVAQLMDSYLTSGNYGKNFDTSGLQSGIYYITLNVNGKSLTKPLNVVK